MPLSSHATSIMSPAVVDSILWFGVIVTAVTLVAAGCSLASDWITKRTRGRTATPRARSAIGRDYRTPR